MFIKKFANWFDLDYRVKPDNDNIENAGRSMVEMLGVLAIIGVLSVGAISGYSKAMFKYKLNKHTEQMNTLINAVVRNVHSFDNIKHKSVNLTSTFIKMGEIPTEMVKANNSDYVYDIFGQQWQIDIPSSMYNIGGITLSSMHLDGSSFLSSKSTDGLAICQNILTIAKEHHDNIARIILATESDDDGGYYMINGDKYCGEEAEYDNRYCLKNLTLDNIYTTCAKHGKGGGGYFQFYWERW